MTETKWTPGNWLIENNMQRGEGWSLISDHEFGTKAGKTYRKYVAQFLAQEDANLLSASRELYEALNFLLKTVVDDLGECGYDEDDIADHEGVKRATAALAKARGET